MITAIVVDDEWAAGEWLALKLKESGRVQVIRVLQNPLELMGCVAETKAQAVFLDIAMPEISGLELAERLSALEAPPEVVFVTAYDYYALEAFRVNAIDYVVKPVHDRELQRILEKLRKRSGKNGRGNVSRPSPETKLFFSVTEASMDFPTTKSEELFFCLLLQSRQLLPKWEIMEALWPGKEPEKGEASLRTAVFRANQTLEKHGLDLRIKASKGYYHFTSASGKEKQAVVRPFPAADVVGEPADSLVEILDRYNFLQLVEEKDYLWAVTVKEYETDYYRWAMSLINRHRRLESECLRAFLYLLGQFPWQEQLLLQSMPLIVKLEGSAALIQFYRQQKDKWERLYGVPLSKTLEQAYRQLL